MYIGGLAGVEKLKSEKPDVVDQVRAVAGLSLGEYTALTFAGVIDFETGLRLVKLRAEAMDAAAEAPPQSMASIAGLDQETVEQLCREAAKPSGVCKIANVLFPKGFSCAGSKDAIAALVKKAEGKPGLLQAKMLKTSGAFHTELMEPAKEKLLKALKDAEPNFKAPKCDIYVNLTGRKIASGTAPSEFVQLLANQLCNCVLWEQSIRLMITDGITEFYECGPAKQLQSMMKRIDPNAHKRTYITDI
jgi:[acyl-carrier-protein] S-malonyltransferase